MMTSDSRQVHFEVMVMNSDRILVHCEMMMMMMMISDRKEKFIVRL